MGDVILGNMPKASKMGVNRQFHSKTPKYKTRNISEITNPIMTKFEDQAFANQKTSNHSNVAIANALQLQVARRHASPFPL